MISINGQQYRNTFTQHTTENLLIQNPLCLSTGVRWEIRSDRAIVPFVEAMAGGNRIGLLASLYGGVSMQYSTSFAFDIGLHADRFMTTGMSPLTGLSVGMTARYAW
jgi:hypothetical protein